MYITTRNKKNHFKQTKNPIHKSKIKKEIKLEISFLIPKLKIEKGKKEIHEKPRPYLQQEK